MIEKLIVLEDIDPVIFYGVNNANMQLIKALYPKLRIVARGNVIKVLGDEEEMCAFEENITKLEKYCAEYNSLKEEVIIDIIKGNAPQAEKSGNVIVFSVTGKPIIPRSENQLKLVEAFAKNDMLFAIGPAGSGKTYTAIALAVRALKNKEIKKIILSRPAVEAGEKLGFLPGDMKDKIDPYLQPLYDALQDMIPAAKLKEYMELNIIQIAPLAFMRGRTLNDAVVILDEAQNTTTQQIKMFLTRMGMNTKMIVTGDMTQIDLPSSQTSGLVQALRILKGVKGISFVELNKKDIVRHKLVTQIVEAYEKFDKEAKAEREKRKAKMKALTKTDFNFPGQKSVYHGKVRDVYNINGEKLVMVATDRISAFDVVLPKGIPFKGQMLNQIAAKFLDATTDICPNWKMATPDPMVTVGVMCEGFPVEMIVRGYLCGSAWRAYKSGVREICGVKLPEGMKENQKFPEPIITPTTKAEIGEHDADISKEEILAQGLATPEEYAVLEKYTMALFKRGTEIAAERGLILVDTKYEFGKHDGKIYLMDEIHTPDSSRYFYSEGYEERFAKGEPQKQLSKEFVREWLMDNGFQGKEGQQVPEMTDEIVTSISERYIELYEHITGEKFVKEDTSNIAERIEKNVTEYLK